MSDAGKPITSQELAAMTKTSERNIREWLANQAGRRTKEKESPNVKWNALIRIENLGSL